MNKLWIGLVVLLLSSIQVDAAEQIKYSVSTHHKDIQQSIKWYRDSAEKNALYRQAYYLGSEYVKNWVSTHHPQPKSWGVIIDIDETALDNSWYYRQYADQVKSESDFEHFVTIPQKSTALPGIIEFVKLVHKLGGLVSFVSNRDGSYHDSTGNSLAATVANLKKEGIGFDQVVLGNYKDSKQPTDKNPRFNAIVNGKYVAQQMVWSNTLPAHQVIAYFGDNIQDFPKLKQVDMQNLPANSHQFDLAAKGNFIMPNPIYGSWEKNEYK